MRAEARGAEFLDGYHGAVLDEDHQGAQSSDGDRLFSKPINILRDVPVPEFSSDCVPALIHRLASDFSAATGFDPAGVVGAATVAASAVIDDRLRLAVRQNSEWFESARLWGLLLGSPSAGKSPTIRAATRPIKDLHVELIAQWAKNNPDPKAEDADPKPALFTSDVTVEKLSDLLRDNPRGMLMLTEEFASWLGSIDAYRDGGGTKSRGEWLQLYDGGPHAIDRVGRGSFIVKNWSCCVLAAATPEGLRRHMKQLPDDGLIHRFVPFIMRRSGDESGASSRDALDAWSRMIRGLYQSTTTDVQARHRLSGSAQTMFDAERRAIRDIVDVLADVSPALASHVGKHPGIIARLALTFHVLEGDRSDAIDVDTMQLAINFARVARRHAAALFTEILGQSSALDLARSLARSILASHLQEVTRNSLTQASRPWRAATETDRRHAVQTLEDAGWLLPDLDSRPYGGWIASRWFVNPQAEALYASYGEEHRRRRQQVRELILGSTDE